MQKLPKYPTFFSVEPLAELAFGKNSDKLPLLDQLLLQLRLTTLMRSVDVANVVWGVFEHDSETYIQTTDKAGTPKTFLVGGKPKKISSNTFGFIEMRTGYFCSDTKNHRRIAWDRKSSLNEC